MNEVLLYFAIALAFALELAFDLDHNSNSNSNSKLAPSLALTLSLESYPTRLCSRYFSPHRSRCRLFVINLINIFTLNDDETHRQIQRRIFSSQDQTRISS